MVLHHCNNPQPRLATLGPGLAIALADSSAWAERDDGVRTLADVARQEAMCDPHKGQHMLVLLGEAEADKGAVARALLARLVSGYSNGLAADNGLAERVQLCLQLAAYFTHEAHPSAVSLVAAERAASAGRVGATLAAQEWLVAFDGTGRPCSLRLELPYSPQGRLPPPHEGAPSDLRCHALCCTRPPGASCPRARRPRRARRRPRARRR